jgi:hypothetical protein
MGRKHCCEYLHIREARDARAITQFRNMNCPFEQYDVRHNIATCAFKHVQPVDNRSQQNSRPVDNRSQQNSRPVDNRSQQNSRPVDNRSQQNGHQVDNRSQQNGRPVDNRSQQNGRQVGGGAVNPFNVLGNI